MGEALITRRGGGGELKYRYYNNPDRHNEGEVICEIKKDCYICLRFNDDDEQMRAVNYLLEYKNGKMSIIREDPYNQDYLGLTATVTDGNLTIQRKPGMVFYLKTVIVIE